MFEGREETKKPVTSISLQLNFNDFPNLKNLTLDDKGNILLLSILSREKVNDKDEVEKWIRINGVRIVKEKRLR